MAVNSKADKTHRTSTTAIRGVVEGSQTPTKRPAFSPSGASGISQAGQKSLMFRARKILAPLANPNQNIVE